MLDQVIHILPDSVANQIAAGEVVQRPASVVKELMENAIDAFAKNIKVYVKDGGKTSIKIIDDGIGMSEVDARLAFERHATSKINDVQDLYAISTFGFRGEALAAISSVAQVELLTRKENSNLGFKIEIHGSKLINQEAIICQQGSTFTVNNIFYNIPARRRFLKSNIIEFKHIIDEFHRIAIAHPNISFSLSHNDKEIYSLAPASLKQRIMHIFGKQLSNELIDIKVETSIVNINGFIGKPEYAKKKSGLQFFFVNNRFMRHPFLYRVILNAYDNLLLAETIPSYFIFFDCDPKNIDVNIHPTKTEIKFDDERAVSQILEAAIRQALGKASILPNFDFESEISIKLPNFSKNQPINSPKIQINSNYNPFEKSKSKSVIKDWQKLFELETFEEQKKIPFESTNESSENGILQIKNQYLLIPVKSGIMIIDQHRAHIRVLYDLLEEKYKKEEAYTEKLIFPETIQLSIHEAEYFKSLIPHLKRLGFMISDIHNGQFNIEGIPSYWSNFNLADTMENFIKQFEENERNPEQLNINQLLIKLAKSSAIKKGQYLSENERHYLFDSLFMSSQPQYTPDGKIIFQILLNEYIDQLF